MLHAPLFAIIANSAAFFAGLSDRPRVIVGLGPVALGLYQPAAKVPLSAKRTAAQGQTGTVNDQAKCGHLHTFGLDSPFP